MDESAGRRGKVGPVYRMPTESTSVSLLHEVDLVMADS